MRVLGTCVAAAFACSSLSLHGCNGGAEKPETHAEANHSDVVVEPNHSKVVTTPLPPLPPAYYALERGTCCCPEEHEVRSMAMCHDALHFVAHLIGFDAKEAENVRWNGTDEHIPPACSFKVWPSNKTGRGHWNRAEKGKARHNMIPICHNHTAEAERSEDDADANEIPRLFDDSVQGVATGSTSSAIACLAAGMVVAGVSLVVVFRRSVNVGQMSTHDAASLIVEDEDSA